METLLHLTQNFIQFVLAAPINLVIMICITLFLKLFGWTIKESLKVIFTYFALCFLFAMAGYNMPTIFEILDYAKLLAERLATAI